MRLLIAGDSWGAGVHQYIKKSKVLRITHTGTEFFLNTKGYEVKNISSSGGSNNNTLNRLKKESLFLYDYIFVFYTNPLRDLQLSKTSNHITIIDLIDMFENLSSTFLKNLNELNHSIVLLGGHNKIEKTEQYENIKILIPSIREWLCPELQDQKYLGLTQKSTYKSIIEQYTPELVNYIFDISQKHESTFKNNKLFYPDGYHLSLPGHQLLAEYLHTYIIENSSTIGQ